ncbi:MAG: universal stress protein [Capnocytophaga sp.]|nr:universal stress protein [Capnocytophaga sp.]
MKNILVTTDFSEKSKAALRIAIDFAKKHHATIYLLHSIDLPMRLATHNSMMDVPEALYFLNLSKTRFDDLKKEISSDVEIHDIIETNVLSISVEEAVKKYAIDLVVMGSNGASGLKEIFIGSNAEKVIRNSSVPVLVIKDPEEKLNVKKIIFACDFSKKFLAPFTKAMEFAKIFDATIDLVYINTPYQFLTTNEINERIDNFLSENADFEKYEVHVYNDIRIETGLLNYISDNEVDLICMFPSGRKGIAHFFNGSISSDLVNHAAKPVLTIKV